MSAAKSPVEQRFDLLRDLWMQATQSPDARLIVWRIPGNADRMLAAFFEMHKQSEDAITPDLFVNFDQPFDTGYAYSRELVEAFRVGYIASRAELIEQGAPANWTGAHEDYPSSALGVTGILSSFAEHHREHLRYVVPVLAPATAASDAALEQWLDAAIRAPVSERLRLAVIDHTDNKRWQPLVDRYRKQAVVIEAPIDLFDIARETAAQSGSAGPTTAYRSMLADVMTLLERGTAAQTVQRADKAMKLAEREQWPDQQVVLHMAVAGAHLKEQQHAEAIARYRAARECAARAEAARHPAGSTMLMQTWFGEAGVWLSAQQPVRAAEAYAQGAEAARRIPNAMFVIEGHRMAGFCLARDGRREAAREHYLRGVGEARPMAPADRPMTTLPLLLQDMLRLQDDSRTGKIEVCAKTYQAEIADAQKQAETQAAKLGDRPDEAELDRIDAAMTARFETAFRKACDERERLIAGGDEFFRKVVAIARDFLHARWNGLPDIKHPLDKDVPEWSAPPEFAQLPDPSDLLDPQAAASSASSTSAAAAVMEKSA